MTCLLQLKDGELEATVSDSHCSGSKPADSVSCQAESCEHFQWVASEWTEVRVVTVMSVCSLIPRPHALSLAVRYRDFSVLLVTEGWVVVRVCTVQGVLLVTEGWVVVHVYRVVYIH